jgi:hypothetical protein
MNIVHKQSANILIGNKITGSCKAGTCYFHRVFPAKAGI